MTTSTSIYLLLLFVFALYYISKCIRRKLQISRFAKAHRCASPPQTPKTWMGLFQAFQLAQALRENHFLDYVQGLFLTYGSTFTYNTFGAQSIWTTEPENIQACLSTQSQDFGIGSSRHKALIPLVGHSILTTDGNTWAGHRALIRPNFMKLQLSNLDILEKHFCNMLLCVPQDNSIFDLRKLFQKLTMDISTDFLLGFSTNSLILHAQGSKDYFADAWDTAISWLPLRCHLGTLMDWIPQSTFFYACRTIHDYADQLVAQALAAQQVDNAMDPYSEKRYIFLQELAKDVTDPVQLRDHVISVLSAGRDATAELLSCTVNLLTRHHEVFDNLRSEVEQLSRAKPTVETLKDMKYLRNVLFEVLRLYPIGPVNARIASRDTTLPVGGGRLANEPVVIQKGQQVLYCVYGLHRRKDLYGSDADSFRPERWDHRRPGGWDFLPFNGGARNCPGQNFAMIEASYILVRLLQEFDGIEASDERPWRENLGLILTNFHGTSVGLKRRSLSGKRDLSIHQVLELTPDRL